jgi:uncharacterized protein YejL (UPF0352 family)
MEGSQTRAIWDLKSAPSLSLMDAIGNSVPMLLKQAIAECLRRSFLGGAASLASSVNGA